MNSETFMTSDTYFGRKSIANARNFDTVDEMNSKLISNWNDKVSDNSIVYHLGNFAWDPITASEILSVLKGTIYFIEGPYDSALKECVDHYKKTKLLSRQIVELGGVDKYYVVSYWPLRDWPKRNEGAIHFHANANNIKENNLDKLLSINVSSDLWDLSPISLEAIYDMISIHEKQAEQAIK
jgi:calcineurin-like phosphoesterase family protein